MTQRELPSSKDIAGVNMRLTAGSFRELHWHTADEWAIMLDGNARISILNPDGTVFVDDVGKGDLWYSLPDFSIRFKVSVPMAASSSSSSTKACSPKTILSRSPSGSPIRRRRCGLRTSALIRPPLPSYRPMNSTFPLGPAESAIANSIHVQTLLNGSHVPNEGRRGPGRRLA